MKNLHVDVVVIGTGSAGKTVAYTARGKGLSVAIVDDRPFGGTCQLRGCDPKKVLIGATEGFEFAKQLKGKGVAYNDLHIDWQALMQFKKTFVEGVPESNEKAFQEAGMHTYHGVAKFIDKNVITINGKRITTKYVVLATGATPMKLGIQGEENITISDDFINLATLPKRIIFIGGGFISFEFAHLAKRAGADVTILHRSEHLLSGFDNDLVQKLVEATKGLGINVLVNTPAESVEKVANSYVVHTTSTDGKKKSFKTDLIVHGAGRMPHLEMLDLEKAGVAYDKKGITVNEYMQSTTNPAVYAAGDAAAHGLPLTPVAGKEAMVVAHNILNSKKKKANFKAIPSVVFTLPPLASVGLREDEAKAKGYDVEVKFSDTSSWYSSKRINEKFAAYKTITDKKSGYILGAHLLGHNAEEIINLFTIAIAKKLTAEDIKNLIYSYPTKTSDIQYMV